MQEHPEPDTPRDDPDLEAALNGPAFDEEDALRPDDPGRPEDLEHEPGAPHIGLDEDQVDETGPGARR